jgi:hypothetical protein
VHCERQAGPGEEKNLVHVSTWTGSWDDRCIEALVTSLKQIEKNASFDGRTDLRHFSHLLAARTQAKALELHKSAVVALPGLPIQNPSHL